MYSAAHVEKVIKTHRTLPNINLICTYLVPSLSFFFTKESPLGNNKLVLRSRTRPPVDCYDLLRARAQALLTNRLYYLLFVFFTADVMYLRQKLLLNIEY